MGWDLPVVETEDRLESLIRDQLIPQIARMDERMTAMEKRHDERMTAMEKRQDERFLELENRFSNQLSAVEVRLDGRLQTVERNVGELARAITALEAEVRERPRTATVVGIVISTVIGVVGLVIGTIALAPYLQP